MDDISVRHAARTIRSLVQMDSSVDIPTLEIVEAIKLDGKYPSPVPPEGKHAMYSDAGLFVMGGEDGEIPDALKAEYPHLDRLIDQYFGGFFD